MTDIVGDLKKQTGALQCKYLNNNMALNG